MSAFNCILVANRGESPADPAHTALAWATAASLSTPAQDAGQPPPAGWADQRLWHWACTSKTNPI